MQRGVETGAVQGLAYFKELDDSRTNIAPESRCYFRGCVEILNRTRCNLLPKGGVLYRLKTEVESERKLEFGTDLNKEGE
jgi:hypothetical protein